MLPFAFYNYKKCPICGKEQVETIDKFGRVMDIPIYPILKLKCKNCKREFFPKWIQDGDDLVLIAGDEESKIEFEEEIINYSLSNRRNLYE